MSSPKLTNYLLMMVKSLNPQKKRVDSVKMDHLPLDVQQKYRKLLTDNIYVFSRTSTDIGCTPLFHGYANVKPGLEPVDFQTKYYPPSQAHQHHVRKLLKQLLQAAIIRQTTQPVPCLANIHVRVKPNGKLRLCLDSRVTDRVNKIGRKKGKTCKSPYF